MSDIIFDRKAKVIISDKYSSQESDNRIIFDIEKSINSLPNIANIKVYNADNDFKNFSERENLKIELYTAYAEEELELLFIGDIKRVYNQYIGTDDIIIFDCGDSETSITNSFLNKSYKNGIEKKQIVKDCLDLMGVDYLTNTLSLITGVYNGGFVCFDKTTSILDTILENLNLEYSFQNNQIIINSKGYINKNDFITISYDTGLIKKPSDLQDGGLQLNTYLKNYIPHKTIYLDVDGYNSFFQIRQVIISGDTQENNWGAEIICQ